MLEIDGRTLEGGGQILRISLCLAALTSQSLRITNIRGNRSGGGGLKKQHLTGLNWLAKACNATVTGNEVKSKEVTFLPGGNASQTPSFSPWNRNFVIDIGTPGAVTLVLQAILPFIIFSPLSHSQYHAPDQSTDGQPEPITVTIQGGTNVSNSPSIDYVARVLFPMLKKLGLPPIKVHMINRGWATGRTQMGSVTFTITPVPYNTSLRAPDFSTRGNLDGLSAIILGPRSLEKEVYREMKQQLKSTFPDLMEIDIEFEDSRHDARLYILIVATTTNGFKLGVDELAYVTDTRRKVAKGQDPAALATKMISRVVRALAVEVERGGCVDEYLRDQLVVFMALAAGRGRVLGGIDEKSEMSLHTKTAWWVVKQMLGVARADQTGTDECEGANLVVGRDMAMRARTE